MVAIHTRQVDKMGRLVIPKEIRDDLHLSGRQLTLTPLPDEKGIKVHQTVNKNEESKVLDRYGRLLIPVDLRNRLGWEQGKQIEVEVVEDYAVLSDQIRVCEICGIEKNLIGIKGKFICERCIEAGNQCIVQKWGMGLDRLMNEYMDYCERSRSFGDREDIRQARVLGCQLHTILQFLNVSSEHELQERLRAAHHLFGKVRERDVLIDSFKKRADRLDHDKQAEVYKQIHHIVDNKRDKHQSKLEKKLPQQIDSDFRHVWEGFLEADLRKYVLILRTEDRLAQYEHTFQRRVSEFEDAASKEGEHPWQALDALHSVDIASEQLRFIYQYLNTLYQDEYQIQADYYKNLQNQIGGILDLRDGLKQFDKHQSKLEVKKKHVKAVNKQLMDELVAQMGRIEYS